MLTDQRLSMVQYLLAGCIVKKGFLRLEIGNPSVGTAICTICSAMSCLLGPPAMQGVNCEGMTVVRFGMTSQVRVIRRQVGVAVWHY
jgi:hypothetical protein